MSATGLSIVTAAFEALQVYQPGDAITNADAQSALGIVNRMLGQWALQSLTIPAVARVVTPLVSGKGGLTSPYTIGIGGNINTARPASQAHVVNAALLLNTPVPAVEVQVRILTDQQYQGLPIKEMASGQFDRVYYNPTFVTGGFGTIHLWPVPDNSVNSLVLYLQQALAAFADLTTVYQLPEGMEETLVSNLARKLAKPFGAVADAELVDAAATSLRVFKRSNFKMADLSNYFRTGGQYDIDSGQTW